MSKKDNTKFFRTKNFQQLQQNWYKKLASTGFVDVEWHHKSLKSRKSSQTPQQIHETLPEKDAHRLTDGFISRFLKNDNARIYNKLRIMSPESLYEYIQLSYSHYHGVENFLTHVRLPNDIDHFLLSHYAVGATYRQITKELQQFVCKYPNNRGNHYSIYWIHTRMHQLLSDVHIWNRQHPNGTYVEHPEELEQ